MAKSVKVYSTPSCPYCRKAKEYLDELSVDYENVNVAVDKDAAQKMVELSGQMGVPVIDVDGKVIVGFDKNALSEALED